jgi:hypothetical protein
MATKNTMLADGRVELKGQVVGIQQPVCILRHENSERMLANDSV